jgi:hypothetical protein
VDLDEIRRGFIDAGFPADLVTEVLDSYVEAKRRFHLGDHRPQAVEGGRFSEGVFRILQRATTGKSTPLGKSLPTVDRLLVTLENASGSPDSIRLHIPRTLKLIYDIRNKRDAAHLGDGIDPNLQDATLVVGNMDWVLAELVRLYHDVSADDAQKVIENVVTKEVPAVQEIAGHPVILKDLQAREQALLLLYRAGAQGATLEDLAAWLRTNRKDNLKARLLKLDEQKLVLAHPTDHRYYITSKGGRLVEEAGWAKPS